MLPLLLLLLLLLLHPLLALLSGFALEATCRWSSSLATESMPSCATSSGYSFQVVMWGGIGNRLFGMDVETFYDMQERGIEAMNAVLDAAIKKQLVLTVTATFSGNSVNLDMDNEIETAAEE